MQLGDVPRERSVDGIRMFLDGSAVEYSEEETGQAMFFSMRSEDSAAADATQQSPTTESERSPRN